MEVKDDIGQVLEFEQTPVRIISLVPSLTELLFEIGLSDEVVGITKFCIHPQTALSSKQKIGGTKKFDFKKIDALSPDLIIANKEENYKEGVERLMEKYPVYVSDIFNLDDACRTIANIGLITGTSEITRTLNQSILTGFDSVKKIESKKVLYFIWQSPYMVAAKNNFVDFILNWLGFENVAGHFDRYPELSEEELSVLNPDVVFLSSEPFPFKEKHVAQFSRLFPRAKIQLVDGEMFSWYGSRLALAPAYFKSEL